MNDRFHLALDLSSPDASLALHRAKDAELVAEAVLPPGNSHSEALLDTLEGLFRDAKTTLAAVDRFVTPSGPGSFTGLRIGWATLKAFCAALERPLDTMSGAEARALAWASTSCAAAGTPVVAVSQVSGTEYARCMLHFIAPGKLRYQSEDSVETAALLAPAPATILLLDDRSTLVGAEKGYATVERFPLRARHLVPALAQAATRRTFATAAEWSLASPDYFGGSRFK